MGVGVCGGGGGEGERETVRAWEILRGGVVSPPCPLMLATA